MYTKKNTTNNTDLPKIQQLKPQILAFEFDQTIFKTWSTVKKWFVENYQEYGFVPNFDDDRNRGEIDDKWAVQVDKNYNDGVGDLRLQCKNETGVQMVVRVYSFTIKDEKKINEILCNVKKLQ